jgi:HAD superfamily hydrolase (TIGR01493 family)
VTNAIRALTFDVFGTLLSLDGAGPWVAQYVQEVRAIEKGEKPYRTLDVIFGEIGADWTELRVRPGVIDALTRLARDFVVAPLSNANSAPALSEAMAVHFGLPWNFTIDISAVGAYKPNRRVYQTALTQLGLPGDHVIHVASHPYDLRAAQAEGLRTAYLQWPQYAEPVAIGEFNYRSPSLSNLADIL